MPVLKEATPPDPNPRGLMKVSSHFSELHSENMKCICRGNTSTLCFKQQRLLKVNLKEKTVLFKSTSSEYIHETSIHLNKYDRDLITIN